MTRALWIAVALGLAGCGKDTDTQDTSDTEDTELDYHPLVPEKYRYLWNTGPCDADPQTDGMQEGVQVYYLMEEGEGGADTDGRFTGTERWYWFFGNNDLDEDFVDTFEIEGKYELFDYGMLDCDGCDVAYSITRSMVEQNGNYTYYSIFGLDERPDEEVYNAMVLFDTHTPTGIQNVDHKMLVVHGAEVGTNTYVMDPVWAIGHAFPEAEDQENAYPSAYDWLGDACLGSGR